MNIKLPILILALLSSGCGQQELPAGSFEDAFDESAWRSQDALQANDQGTTMRQRMLGDLVNKHLIGQKRDHIIAMLGEPSSKMDPDGDGPSLSYPTGWERWSYIRIDSEWLLIHFDSAGVAAGYSIAVD